MIFSSKIHQLFLIVLIAFFLTGCNNKTSQDEKIIIENKTKKKPTVEQEKENESKKTDKEENLTTYENKKYNYAIRFSDDWFINTKLSENETEKVEDEDLLVGGETFWSNYPDINKYTSEEKPDDFYILALLVYEDKSGDIETFSKKICADDETIQIKFDADNVSGFEFFSAGLTEENPKITIIFQKENLFYVFNLAFASDEEIIEKMKNVIKTFKMNI